MRLDGRVVASAMSDVPVRVDARVEVLDETSPFYHFTGYVLRVRRGRVLVQFGRKSRIYPYDPDKNTTEVEFAADQVGLARDDE